MLTLTELISSLNAFEQRLASRDDEDSIKNNINKRGGKRQENSRSSNTSRRIENKTEDRRQYFPCGICKKTKYLERIVGIMGNHSATIELSTQMKLYHRNRIKGTRRYFMVVTLKI
ncbi:hypothetical protein HN51_026068 [Arachis hypogaea]